MPMSSIASSLGRLSSVFLRNCHTDLHSGCTSFHSIPATDKCSSCTTLSPELAVIYFIDLRHSDRKNMELQCSFDLHFSDF